MNLLLEKNKSILCKGIISRAKYGSFRVCYTCIKKKKN